LNVLFILFYQTKLFVLSSFRINSLSGTNPLFQKQLEQFEITRNNTVLSVCMKISFGNLRNIQSILKYTWSKQGLGNIHQML
jgi:hypothetical protein